jgi:hypothetical protein
MKERLKKKKTVICFFYFCGELCRFFTILFTRVCAKAFYSKWDNSADKILFIYLFLFILFYSFLIFK